MIKHFLVCVNVNAVEFLQNIHKKESLAIPFTTKDSFCLQVTFFVFLHYLMQEK